MSSKRSLPASAVDGSVVSVRAGAKRLIDVVGSVVGLVVFGLPMLVVAVLIRWRMGSPVLLPAPRPGLGGRVFAMYKFRTMHDVRDAQGELLPDEERIGRLGRILRAWSLDELPQLLNVLLGDMSLVGPRPLLVEYLDRYTPEQARRHDVRPGMTGWTQVAGRNSISWDDKLRLDVRYVDEWSLWLDAKILVRTVLQVLTRKDVSAPGHATMPEFDG